MTKRGTGLANTPNDAGDNKPDSRQKKASPHQHQQGKKALICMAQTKRAFMLQESKNKRFCVKCKTHYRLWMPTALRHRIHGYDLLFPIMESACYLHKEKINRALFHSNLSYISHFHFSRKIMLAAENLSKSQWLPSRLPSVTFFILLDILVKKIFGASARI